MSTKSRLERLERLQNPDGSCPGCGMTPDQVRTAFLTRHPPYDHPANAGKPILPFDGLMEDEPPSPPDRPRCPVCGDWADIRVVKAFDYRHKGYFYPESWPERGA